MNVQDRRLIMTADGSHSISLPDLNITFHSRHGAIQESKHVFIEAGYRKIMERFPLQPINILEVGLGTGLNAFLTAIACMENDQLIRYTGLETHPLDMATSANLNYPEQLGHVDLFDSIQLATWNSPVSIHNTFSIRKQSTNLLEYEGTDPFHLIYFDAFAPDVQPQLWTEFVFQSLARNTLPGGMLVTYCSKGSVRRAMEAAGWKVEKLQGPKGKREMVRASIPVAM